MSTVMHIIYTSKGMSKRFGVRVIYTSKGMSKILGCALSTEKYGNRWPFKSGVDYSGQLILA
jgi:hypothetical protein